MWKVFSNNLSWTIEPCIQLHLTTVDVCVDVLKAFPKDSVNLITSKSFLCKAEHKLKIYTEEQVCCERIGVCRHNIKYCSIQPIWLLPNFCLLYVMCTTPNTYLLSQVEVRGLPTFIALVTCLKCVSWVSFVFLLWWVLGAQLSSAVIVLSHAHNLIWYQTRPDDDDDVCEVQSWSPK